MDRYNHLNKYLINKFGTRTLKVCIDAHFTCPNRDGTKGYSGCIFCGAKGAGELIKGKLPNRLNSITNQINTFLSSYRGERAEKFIVYFQAFTGTYDSIKNLKQIYDTALLTSEKFVGLQIATRPDQINKEIAKLLATYKEKYYVCVELGLQTANEIIGKNICRCYTNSDYINACKILDKYGIDVVTHMMIGLPNECEQDVIDTVRLINNSHPRGVKISNTYVVKNTKLQQMYQSGNYTPITLEYYVSMVGKVLKMLNKDIIIHRITGDPAQR